MSSVSLRRGALLAALWGTACARHGPAPPPAPVEAEFILQVENHHWLDVVVYIERNGERLRVGTVTAVTTQTFTLPSWMLGPMRQVRLVGDAIGSSAVIRTETVVVQPGQYIQWTLENDLQRSSVAVY